MYGTRAVQWRRLTTSTDEFDLIFDSFENLDHLNVIFTIESLIIDLERTTLRSSRRDLKAPIDYFEKFIAGFQSAFTADQSVG